MSKKTSTAALDSFREGQLPNRRRAPRHPTGEKRSKEATKQRSNEPEREFGQARIAVREEDVMNGINTELPPRRIRTILPVILRITFCLLLWTLGASSMRLVEAQTLQHHELHKLPVNRTRIENLQRWVNNGHDTWCRDRKVRRHGDGSSDFAGVRALRFRIGLADDTRRRAFREQSGVYVPLARRPHLLSRHVAPLQVANENRGCVASSRLGAGPDRNDHARFPRLRLDHGFHHTDKKEKSSPDLPGGLDHAARHSSVRIQSMLVSTRRFLSRKGGSI